MANRSNTVLTIGLTLSLSCQAQDYHAIEGSPYAGAIGAANNPASIVNQSYPWDITLFSVQEANTSNALRLTHFGYLTKDTIHYTWTNGRMARYVGFDFNMPLIKMKQGGGGAGGARSCVLLC